MAHDPHDPQPAADRLLSLWDAICLIVGIIIGASIYQAPPEIFRSAGSASAGMYGWLIGGVVSLLGALCYAELASAYRTSGGDYTYLCRAYGNRVGFIFAWAELAVIRTGGSIAFMAYVFANYATEFYDLGPQSRLLYAITGILGLTLINALGVRPGRFVQNALTTANIIGLTGIVLIGVASLFVSFGPSPEAKQALSVASATLMSVQPESAYTAAATLSTIPSGLGSYSLALTMVLVFYAYGGWNEAAFIASEVAEPRRNVRRALLLGTMLVTTIYLAVNLAYLTALGYYGVCSSNAVAGEMFALPFGEPGRKAISALVMISALGSVHGLLFTGMRLYGTFGNDHRVFRWLARDPQKPTVAYGALFAQAAFSLLLISVVELSAEWRRALALVAPVLDLNVPDNFHQQGGIYQLVTCTAPVFWLFFLLTGGSLFILRYRDADTQRPFRVPCYPVVPLIFCGSCAFMLYRSATYAIAQEPAEAIVVAGLMLLGIPLCLLPAGRKPAPLDGPVP